MTKRKVEFIDVGSMNKEEALKIMDELSGTDRFTEHKIERRIWFWGILGMCLTGAGMIFLSFVVL